MSHCYAYVLGDLHVPDMKTVTELKQRTNIIYRNKENILTSIKSRNAEEKVTCASRQLTTATSYQLESLYQKCAI